MREASSPIYQCKGWGTLIPYESGQPENETPNSRSDFQPPRPHWQITPFQGGQESMLCAHHPHFGHWFLGATKRTRGKSLKSEDWWNWHELTIFFCKWNNNRHQSCNNESIEPRQNNKSSVRTHWTPIASKNPSENILDSYNIPTMAEPDMVHSFGKMPFPFAFFNINAHFSAPNCWIWEFPCHCQWWASRSSHPAWKDQCRWGLLMMVSWQNESLFNATGS